MKQSQIVDEFTKSKFGKQIDKDAEIEKVISLSSITSSKGSKTKIPKTKQQNDYSKEVIINRIKWLEEKTNVKLFHITQFSEDPEKFKGNIENLIGCAQIPIGIAGPLKVVGEYANGEFYIPMATTEGALLTSYQTGMRIVTKAGGVKVKILKDEMHISPVFVFNSLNEIDKFAKWIDDNLHQIKKEAEETTRFGKLLEIEKIIIPKRIFLRFVYNTADAMGMNMINFATDQACKFILKNYVYKNEIEKFFIRPGFSSDKKVSFFNIFKGFGKAVFAEVIVPKEVLRLLKISSEDFFEYYKSFISGNIYTGMVYMNGQISNAIASIFIACGQDVAHTINSAIGISSCEVTKEKNLYFSTYLPNLLVGTVGGGTNLATQRECLEILDCYGIGKSKKFAEIVAATVLTGDLSIGAAIINGSFIEGHKKLGRKNS
jgi:hydroxymethylglutaryl-CoA reductase (NADPH)